jgi:hypothetical protein
MSRIMSGERASQNGGSGSTVFGIFYLDLIRVEVTRKYDVRLSLAILRNGLVSSPSVARPGRD